MNNAQRKVVGAEIGRLRAHIKQLTAQLEALCVGEFAANNLDINLSDADRAALGKAVVNGLKTHVQSGGTE